MNLIFVAGMHRSGTSFIAELVHELGAATGDDLIEPAADNPHGFFEDASIKALNDRVLERLESAWDRPAAGLTTAWGSSAGLDGYRAEAAAIIDRLVDSAEGAPAIVIKDPRFSLTAPFWRSVVTASTVLVPLRDPRLVAASLRHRNGMAPDRAAALWLRYTTTALLEWPAPVVVPLAELVARPRDAVARLADVCGLDTATDAAHALAASRSPTRDPERAHSGFTHTPTTHLADAVFHALCRVDDPVLLAPILERLADHWRSTPVGDLGLAADGDDRSFRDAAAARLAELTERLEAESVNARDLRHERDAAKREARAVAAETATMRSSLDRAKADLTTLRSQLETSDAELAKVRQETERLEVRLDEEQQATAGLKLRLDEAQQAAASLTTEVSAAEAELQRAQATAVTSHQQAEEQRRRLQQQVDQAAARARAAERTHDRLKQRRSVRTALRTAAIFAPAIRTARRVRSPRTPTSPSTGKSADGDAGQDRGRDWSAIVDRLSGAPDVTVVVPVYNAVADVDVCLARLVRWTPRNVKILVIDDASPDPEIAPLLKRHAAEAAITVLRNEHNLGFTGTVNRGMAWADGDVVLLNSDARVGPNWLQSLRIAAYSGERVASASATSDNAGAFSLPEAGANASPGLDEDSLARLYSHAAARRWLASPTAHGFCAFLRRDAINEVGLFDAGHFPRGYGEENDWSMRAGKAGWSHVIDESTMVFHANAASFSPDAKAELVASARRIIDDLHPTYTTSIRSFFDGDMQLLRQDARAIHARAAELASEQRPVRPRLLSVVHKGRGGTPETNLDLMGALEHDWDPWVLTSDGRHLELSHIIDGEPALQERIDTGGGLGTNCPTNASYREAVTRILIERGFELVHVRHLFKHSQDDLPDVIRALGVPAVLSFHDFFWVCPNIHLLDDRGNFCRGRCTSGDGACDAPMMGRPLDEPLKHHWVHTWRTEGRRRLASFDRFVTTSPSAADILVATFPEVERCLSVIPHGRDLVQRQKVAVAPSTDPIRIVVVGNLSHAKGGDFLRELLIADQHRRLDVHILGNVEPLYEDLRCTFHGPYERDDLPRLLAELQPSFGALLSIWPETWSHTLSECWSVGLPVLVSHDGGALFDRVTEHGGGWVIDTGNASAALTQILDLASDPDRWNAEAANANVEHQLNVHQMAERYREVYKSAASRGESSAVAVDVHVVRSDGKSPGSAHVRALRRFSHPAISTSVQHSLNGGRANQLTAPPATVRWIERSAVDVFDVDRLLRDHERDDARLIVDLDDDLLHPEGLPAKFAEYIPTMRRLVRSADIVTVSTPFLVDVVSPFANDVVLLPNQLDETLWWPGAEGPTTPRKPPDETIDVLYMGTDTHGEDLALLKEPLATLRHNLGRPVRIWVAGGAPKGPGEWFDRLDIPGDAREYPAFVSWLRSVAPKMDFAVAPLVDTQFTRSKSDLKFLEYSALGLPSIVSNVESYRHTVRHDVDGLLTDNEHDAWAEALMAMSDRETQERLRSAAVVTVQGRTIGSTAPSFVELLSDPR